MAQTECSPSVDPRAAIPDLPGRHLPRPRLAGRIGAAGANITAIIAGGGYGKSVLLREWVDTFPGITAALRAAEPGLDAATALTAILGSIAEQSGDPDRRIRRALERRRCVDDHVRAVIEDTLGALSTRVPIAIVIDDVHNVREEELAVLVSALGGAGRAVTIVLAGRRDLSALLLPWKLSGRPVELRQTDLAFTVDETRDLVRLVGDAELDPPCATLLADKTEGWPAGVLLAALAMTGGEDPGEVIRSFAGSDRFVADYFLDRVLDGIPEELRDFLLRVAVLDEITLDAAVRVSGRPDAGAVLRDVEARQLFTTRTTPVSYRFHQLFADLLRNEARSADRDAFDAAHRHAAAHYQHVGDHRGVRRHLTAAGETEALADFLVDRAADICATDGAETLRSAIEPLPASILDADPRRMLVLAHAVAATGDVPRALAIVERLADRHPANADALHQVEWFRAICLAVLADLDRAADALDRIGRDGPTSVPGPPISALWPQLPLAFAVADRWDDFDREWQRGESQGLDMACSPVGLAGVQSLVAAMRGFVHHAGALVAGAHAVAGPQRPTTLEAAHLDTAAAMVSLEHGDLRTAAQDAERAIAGYDRCGPATVFRAHGEAVHAEVVRRSGQPARALSLLRSARARVEVVLQPQLGSILAEAELRCACDIGDVASARRAQEQLGSTLATMAAEARVALLVGNRARAADALPSDDDLATLAAGHPRRAVELLALRARASAGREPDRDVLRRAVALAADHELLGSLASSGLCHADLLRVADPQAVHRLSRAAFARDDAGREPVERLTARELEILRLLPTEMGHRELAAETYISLNTLKTHLKAIYRKLDAGSRLDAVRRARQFGLVPPRQVDGARAVRPGVVPPAAEVPGRPHEPAARDA